MSASYYWLPMTCRSSLTATQCSNSPSRRHTYGPVAWKLSCCTEHSAAQTALSRTLVWFGVPPHCSAICPVVHRPGSSSCGQGAVQPAAGGHGALLPPPAALPGRAAQHLSHLGCAGQFDSVVHLRRGWGAPADQSRPDEADPGQQRETRRIAKLLNEALQQRYF